MDRGRDKTNNMKDTQGNNITEEEFTKDIGHRAEHFWCCATQENEGKCNCKLIVNKEDTWQERFDEKFLEGKAEMLGNLIPCIWTEKENVKVFIKTEIDKAYKLGMCVGTHNEPMMWSEIVKMIKNNK